MLLEKQWYLMGVSWEADTDPSEATIFEDNSNEFHSLTEQEWNEVHYTNQNNAYLIVPITRHEDIFSVITIDKEITVKNVISKVHEFYHTPLTEQQINDARNFEDTEYKDELLKNASQGIPVYYIDLIGCAKYFEGIQRVDGNVYKLKLGS